MTGAHEIHYTNSEMLSDALANAEEVIQDYEQLLYLLEAPDK